MKLGPKVILMYEGGQVQTLSECQSLFNSSRVASKACWLGVGSQWLDVVGSRTSDGTSGQEVREDGR